MRIRCTEDVISKRNRMEQREGDNRGPDMEDEDESVSDVRGGLVKEV